MSSLVPKKLCYTVWWMRVGIKSQLSSISASLTDLKRIQMPNRLFWDFRADITFQRVCQAKEFNLSLSTSLCQSSGNHSQHLFEKTVKAFDCKING